MTLVRWSPGWLLLTLLLVGCGSVPRPVVPSGDAGAGPDATGAVSDATADVSPSALCDDGGACVACVEGYPCTPAAGPCHEGVMSCQPGREACVEMGPVAAPGTSCGAGRVCNQAGVCVACAGEGSCTIPGKPCLVGAWSCATGERVCTAAGMVEAGKACGRPQSCRDGVYSPPELCDGAGACRAADPYACERRRCANDVCATSCPDGTCGKTCETCAANQYCSGPADTGACVSRVRAGGTCTRTEQCVAGTTCDDAVCCTQTCGACEVCSAPGGTCVKRGGSCPAWDLDADGAPDILGRDRQGRLWAHFGTGKGGLKDGRALVNGRTDWGEYTDILAPGNFDGDAAGTGDLVARDKQGRAWLFKGKGNGTVAEQPVQIDDGWNAYDAVFAVRNFDNKGGPDIMGRTAVAVGGSKYAHLCRGKGDGTVVRLEGQPSCFEPWSGPGWEIFDLLLGIGSIDAALNSHPDILLRAPGSYGCVDQADRGCVATLLGNGQGGWAEGNAIQSSGPGWSDFDQIISVGDFDGDTFVDVVCRVPSDPAANTKAKLVLVRSNGQGPLDPKDPTRMTLSFPWLGNATMLPTGNVDFGLYDLLVGVW